MPIIIQVLLTDFPNPNPGHFIFLFSNILPSQFDKCISLFRSTHSFQYCGFVLNSSNTQAEGVRECFCFPPDISFHREKLHCPGLSLTPHVFPPVGCKDLSNWGVWELGLDLQHPFFSSHFLLEVSYPQQAPVQVQSLSLWHELGGEDMGRGLTSTVLPMTSG